MTLKKAEETPLVLPNVPGLVDVKLEEEGVWFSHAPEEGEPGEYEIEGFQHNLLDEKGNGLKRLQVTSRHTKAYENAEDRRQTRLIRTKKNKRIRMNRIVTEELTGQICIKNWEWTDTEGNDIPFDRRLAVAMMTRPEMRHHKLFAHSCVMKLQGEMDDVAEEDEQD
jgi:hypothetical protein